MIFDTLTLTRRYPVPVARLWRAWTDPTERATWSPPGPGFEVEFLCAETREGGVEVSICRGPGHADIRCDLRWLTVQTPAIAVNTETISQEDKVLSHALVTAAIETEADCAALTLTVQLASLERDMAAGYRQGFSAALDNIGRLLD